jgi:DNA-binding NarL/FixJ family response regulator
MAAGGLGNKDIALKLRLSLHTVRNHIQSVLVKLDAHSKLEAVVIAGRQGLLD